MSYNLHIKMCDKFACCDMRSPLNTRAVSLSANIAYTGQHSVCRFCAVMLHTYT